MCSEYSPILFNLLTFYLPRTFPTPVRATGQPICQHTTLLLSPDPLTVRASTRSAPRFSCPVDFTLSTSAPSGRPSDASSRGDCPSHWLSPRRPRASTPILPLQPAALFGVLHYCCWCPIYSSESPTTNLICFLSRRSSWLRNSHSFLTLGANKFSTSKRRRPLPLLHCRSADK